MTAVADSAGVRIAYARRGAGPPVLMLHGLGYAAAGWGPAADALAERFELLLVDNRGIGASDAPPGPYTAAQLAADAVAVLDDAGVERADVVGISLGGMAAQELAISWPQRVGRLVLAATTPGGPRSHPWPDATARLLAGEANGDVRRLVADALGPGTPEAIVDRILDVRARTAQPIEAWRAQAAASAAFDAYDRLGAIAAPTLVIHGDADTVIDHRNAALLARLIPGARAELVPGGGHLLPWDHPDRFAAIVAGFLQR
ncbi:MAG TPA: alpha/beta hydrolase [Capillimicrobium sp.]|nr:alpha/beta hydrolase [Capillimicrobium sp.]